MFHESSRRGPILIDLRDAGELVLDRPRGSSGPRTHDEVSMSSVHRPPTQPGAIGGVLVRVDCGRLDVAGNASVRTFAPGRPASIGVPRRPERAMSRGIARSPRHV